jgi:hypothetical protein
MRNVPERYVEDVVSCVEQIGGGNESQKILKKAEHKKTEHVDENLRVASASVTALSQFD